MEILKTNYALIVDSVPPSLSTTSLHDILSSMSDEPTMPLLAGNKSSRIGKRKTSSIWDFWVSKVGKEGSPKEKDRRISKNYFDKSSHIAQGKARIIRSKLLSALSATFALIRTQSHYI